MKLKTKSIFVLLLITFITITSFSIINAHSVELDPNSLISFPWMITNGKGNITIKDSVTNYTLYYQAIEIPTDDYSQIQKIKDEGNKTLETINTELTTLRADYDNLKEIYNKKYAEYKTAIDNGTTQEEINTLKTAYETAKTNFENKQNEYNAKVTEYNTKANEIVENIKKLTPTYVENNWIKTPDGSFVIDLSQFSGQKAFTVWAKLITSDGTIYYDESTYTTSGSKVDNVEVTSVSLDKTYLSLEPGSSYTLTATLTPSDATNKLLSWSSNNEKVATVVNGKVTAISEGTATITVTTKDGNHTANCTVTVTKSSSSKPSSNGDKTISNSILPNTGDISRSIGFSILAFAFFGIIMYKKFKNLKFK